MKSWEDPAEGELSKCSTSGLCWPACLRQLQSKAWPLWPSLRASSQALGRIHLEHKRVVQILVHKPMWPPGRTETTLISSHCSVSQVIPISSCRMREASSRPKREYKPKPRETYDFTDTDQSNGGFSCNPTPKVSGKVVPCVCTPKCLWSSLLGMEGNHGAWK